MNRWLLAVFALVILGGCLGPPPPIAMYAPDSAVPPHVFLARIHGEVCHNWTFAGTPTEQRARDDMAREAAKIHAHAILDIVCQQVDFWHNNCGSGWRCSGEAVVWVPPDAQASGQDAISSGGSAPARPIARVRVH
jgi:hypothetical protein